MPENWKTYKFSDFALINPSIPLKRGVEHPYIEMKDLDSNSKYALSKRHRELKGGSRFQNGDTLCARISPCLENGKICQAKLYEEQFGYGSTEFLVFRGKENISDSEFIYYVSRSPQFRAFSENRMIGTSGRQRIAKEAYEDFIFDVPSLPEQRAIASILSALDDKIENNLAMNKTLEEMAMALYKHWFVDFGPFQEGNFSDSELGPIPEGWEVKSVYEVADYINGAAFKPKDFEDDGLYVIKIAELKNGISANTKKTNREVKDELILKNGSVLFSWSASLDVFLWDKGKALLNQHIFNVLPNGFLPIEILLFMLKNVISHFQSIAAGRATTMGHITQAHLKETLIAVPDDNNLISISSEFKIYYDLLLNNMLEVQTLTQLRDTLLPKLISGEVRLAAFEEEITAAL